MFRSLLRGRAIAGGFIAFAAAAVITATALSPALGTGPEGITSFSGSSSGAIVTSHNSGTGQAISASGSTGAGTGVIYATTGAAGSTAIRGYSTSTSLTPSYGVIGVSKNAFGIEALSYSPTSPALFAYNVSTTTGTAIKGQSAGNAVTGISTKANGVVGQASATPTPMPTALFALAGVLGRDTSTGTNNAGVAGTSTNGTGVKGFSSHNVGVEGDSSSGDGVDASSSSGYGVNGIGGFTGVLGVSSSGIGVRGSSNHSNGVFAETSATPLPNATTLPNSGNINTAALAVEGHGGAPLIIARNSSGADVMSLDNVGSLILTGSVTSPGGTPLVVHRTTLGRDVITYSGHQSLPSIEDFGEAQLVNGQAYVPLDSTFAATIDPRTRYLVFITPQGDTQGLYATQKTPTGFIVREHGLTHSTIAFDYRIVAKPLGSNARYLPLINLPAPGANPPRPRPVVLPLPRNQTRP